MGEPNSDPKNGEKEPEDQSVDFATVLETELDRIIGSRKKPSKSAARAKAMNPPTDAERLSSAIRRAHKAKLVGLAFSGGGIRSATFNLGVLQALAKHKLLKVFHYLSTVSGGGYIGAWFQAWVHRERKGYRDSLEEPGAPEHPGGMDKVENDLTPDWIRKKVRAENDESPAEAREINFLRRYSNFLTPKLGWFGADMWTAIAIYLRNFLLNLLLIVSAFSALLLACHFLGAVAPFLERSELDQTTFQWKFFSIFVPFVLLVISSFFIIANLRYDGVAQSDFEGKKNVLHKAPPYTRPAFIQVVVILSFFLVAIFAAPALTYWTKHSWFIWGLVPALFVGTVLAIFVSIVFQDDSFLSDILTFLRADYRDNSTVRGYVTGVFFGFIAGVGLFVVSSAFVKDENKQKLDAAQAIEEKLKESDLSLTVAASLARIPKIQLPETAKTNIVTAFVESRPPLDKRLKAVFFPPLVILVLVLTSFLYVGLMGRQLREQRREWWSRLNAFSLVWAVIWIVVMTVALFGAQFMNFLVALSDEKLIFTGGGVAWVLSTVAGVLSAKSDASRKDGGNPFVRTIAVGAPYIFIAGLFLLLSWGIAAAEIHDPSDFESTAHPILRPLLASLGFLVLALFLSTLLDVNHFSMHMMYRNRLARCYLGASNKAGKRHPFTGFDQEDDFELARLKKSKGEDLSAPYPIINTTLNIVGGKELAWQKRKADSFVFTPEFSGYDGSRHSDGQRTSYYNTGKFANSSYPVELGMATAISGAAASPNMGSHTAPATAFLLTVFNVRLGWWIGNPAHRRGRIRSSPDLTLLHLLLEMFGLTTASGRYVYLSDGGHFENLGVYELVRRRCRFILVCDAEQDKNFEFGGLGNAIEKCRSDLGIEIELNVDQIRNRNQKGHSNWHWAVGSIHYGKPEDRGIIVYVKSSLSGDAPEDVLHYAAKNKMFPHQSTADQWFDESQFESYRRLGEHIVDELFEGVSDVTKNPDGGANAEGIFSALKERWYPPSAENTEKFSRHAVSLTRIHDELRNNPDLAFLSPQIYPEWKQLLGLAKQPAPARGSIARTTPEESKTNPLPTTLIELRHGFYMCNSMIQLMEEVYLDLNLETHHGHPDNRGWINLFKHWSWSSMLRVTWTVSASSYGARFQTYCERKLGLKLGNVRVKKIKWPTKKALAAKQGYLGLNFHECNLLQHLHESTCKESPTSYELLSFIIEPSPGDPPPRNGTNGQRARFPEFNVGFCVLKGETIVYFRIQDHLRKMGLAGRAIRALIERDADDQTTELAGVEDAPPEELVRIGEASVAGNDLLRAIFASIKSQAPETRETKA